MEDFKVRLVEEYKQLDERVSKLETALSTDNFQEKVGKVQYISMIQQLTGMRVYKEALEYRLKDLKIKL
ncbi:hypothetical protein [uncultured phage cr106_1]|uniref:Uncharacterized protein n=1 Tax=uncultured phage cr106_1 TaxID=2772062 RepID=A0A7M1RVF3_9CAUD|nr:VOG0686 [uncultured phage cr106_1]QOR58276.1 hypothetical protein [uncultured phage cr106_1]